MKRISNQNVFLRSANIREISCQHCAHSENHLARSRNYQQKGHLSENSFHSLRDDQIKLSVWHIIRVMSVEGVGIMQLQSCVTPKETIEIWERHWTRRKKGKPQPFWTFDTQFFEVKAGWIFACISLALVQTKSVCVCAPGDHKFEGIDEDPTLFWRCRFYVFAACPVRLNLKFRSASIPLVTFCAVQLANNDMKLTCGLHIPVTDPQLSEQKANWVVGRFTSMYVACQSTFSMGISFLAEWWDVSVWSWMSVNIEITHQARSTTLTGGTRFTTPTGWARSTDVSTPTRPDPPHPLMGPWEWDAFLPIAMQILLCRLVLLENNSLSTEYVWWWLVIGPNLATRVDHLRSISFVCRKASCLPLFRESLTPPVILLEHTRTQNLEVQIATRHLHLVLFVVSWLRQGQPCESTVQTSGRWLNLVFGTNLTGFCRVNPWYICSFWVEVQNKFETPCRPWSFCCGKIRMPWWETNWSNKPFPFQKQNKLPLEKEKKVRDRPLWLLPSVSTTTWCCQNQLAELPRIGAGPTGSQVSGGSVQSRFACQQTCSRIWDSLMFVLPIWSLKCVSTAKAVHAFHSKAPLHLSCLPCGQVFSWIELVGLAVKFRVKCTLFGSEIRRVQCQH